MSPAARELRFGALGMVGGVVVGSSNLAQLFELNPFGDTTAGPAPTVS